MLTQKQESFCIAYIETGNASESYRRAFNAGNMSEPVINNKASALLKRDDIRVRLAELRQPAIEKAQITLEQHLDDLKRLRDAALIDEKYGPAIQAEIARGKASGLYIERVETGQPGDFERLTDEELYERIEAKQRALADAKNAIGAAQSSARTAAKTK